MAKFTFDDFMKAKKEGRVRWDTDALNRDLEQTRGLLDSVSRQQTGKAKLWGYDDIEKNRKTVNDLSGRSAYLRAYINSTKGSKEYDELNEAYDQMSRGLRSAGQYLDARRSYVKPNSGTLAGDIEETMHPTLLGIDPAGYKKQAQARAADGWSKALYMSNKYGNSIKTLSDADKAKESAEDDEERKWLDGYKLSLAENMSDYEARKAYIGEKSDKNKAILKNKIARGEEKSRQKQYEGLSFGELMAEAQKPEKSSEESKWLKNRAYEIAADWDLAAYNEELRREYNKLDSPEYRAKHSEPGGYESAEKRKAEILNEMEAVKQQRTVNQRNSSIEGYEKVKEKPDFEEKSAYREVGGVYGGSDEARPDEGAATYNYINTEKARTGEISRESIDYLDDEQRKVFNYLYNTEGADAAEDYIEALTPELNRRMTEANTSRAYNEGETNPFVASAVSVGTNLMSGFGIIEDIINSIGGRPIDVNSPAHLNANITTAYRGGVTSGIDKSMKGAGAPKWLQDMPSWGYQAGMSAIDSAVTMAAATLVTAGVGELAAVGDIALSADTLNTITSTTSSVIMGSQVATQTVIEAKNRGLSDDQAVTMGVLYGLVEGLSEKYSIETILKEPTSIRQMLMKSFIAEGSEEVVANWGDRLVDAMIERGSDQLTEEYNRLRKAGYSETQASLMVFWDCVKEDASAFLAGGLSGLAMSGAHAAINKTSEGVSMGALKLAEKLAEKADYVSAAKEAMSSEGWDTVRFIDEAKEQAEEQGNKKALRLLENIDKTVYKHGVDKVSYADVANVLTLLDRGKSAEALGTSEQAPKDGKAQKKSNSAQAQGDGRAYSTVESKDGAEIRSYHFGESHKNGIIMKDAQGNTHTIVAVESSEAYHGERTNTVTLREADGIRWSADELSASDSDINALLGIASSYRTRGAQALMANWESYKSHAEEQGREASLGEYQKYFFALYNAGVTGLDADTTQSSAIYRGAYNALGLRAARSATASGYNDGVQRFGRRARALQKLRIPGLKRSIESRVYIPEGARVRLSDNTKALLDGVARRIGRDIVLDEGLDGSVNGLFDPTDGKLHLRADINDSYAVAAALHEAVHSITDVNPEGYEALRAFVMNYHALIGNDVEAMIELKGAEYGEKAPTREARIEEIVANTVMALAADENALNKAIGIEKNKSLLEKVAEVIKELAQRVKRFIRENTTNEEAKAILDDAEALDMLAELFAQAADEAKENLSGMNEGAIEKENAHRGARYSFAVNDVIDEGYEAPLSDEEEQALWDDEAQRREVDLYNVPKGESYFDSHEDGDIGKLTEESSESAVMILSGSAQNTAEKAIRGFKQFELDEGDLESMVEDIAKDYEIDLEENPGIAGELRSIVTDFIAQVEEGRISTHMAVSTMMKRIRQQLEHAYRWEIDPEAKRIRDDIIGELRETIRNPIIVRDYEASIIAEEYGSYDRFRRMMFGKVGLKLARNIKGAVTGNELGNVIRHLKEVYGEAITNYGDVEVDSDDSVYGLIWLEHIVNSDTYDKSYVNPWLDGEFEDVDTAAMTIAYDIIGRVVEQKSEMAQRDSERGDKKTIAALRKAAETSKREFIALMDAQQADYEHRLREAEKKHNELLDELGFEKARQRRKAAEIEQKAEKRAEAKYLERYEKARETMARQRSREHAETLRQRQGNRDRYRQWKQKTRARYVEKNAKYRDNYNRSRALTAVIAGIKRLANTFESTDKKATKQKYFPQEVKNAGVVTALEELTDKIIFDPDSGLDTRQARARGLHLPGLNGSVGQAVMNLKAALSSLVGGDQSGDYGAILTADFLDEMERLAKELQDDPNKLLSLENARTIYGYMKVINHAINHAREQIGRKESITNRVSGERVIDGTLELGEKKGFIRLLYTARGMMLNSKRMARMYSGYNDDSEFMYHTNELESGWVKWQDWSMDARKAFMELTESSAENRRTYRDSLNKVINVTFTENNGQKRTVRMTRMQGLTILMTWQRELTDGHLIHMQTGGIEISDPKTVLKGMVKISDIFGENTQRIRAVNIDFIKAVEDQMTDFEREYRKIAERYFNEVSRDAINEVMLKLWHREIADSKYYIPILVDKDFVGTHDSELSNINDVKVNTVSIENRGSYKSTVPRSQKPIRILSLNTIIDKHINETGQLYGLGIPVRNMKRAFNTVTDDQKSVRSAFSEVFGKEAVKYINNMMTDIETPRSDADEFGGKLESALRKGFAHASLVFNGVVAMKQTASFLTAARYINIAHLTTAWGSFFRHNVGVGRLHALMEEIDSHTPLHFIRRVGLTSSEIADLQTRLGSKLNSWLPNASVILNPEKWIQGMDCLTTAVIWDAAKNQISAEYRKDKGRIGSEEYWQKVTELYERTIMDTQPMYDVLHRSEAQKSRNAIARSATRFATQPFQNSGILFDALGEMIAKHDKKSVKGFASAVGSQLASALIFAGMSFLGAMMRHKKKRYLDEDGDLTFWSIAGGILSDFGEGLVRLLAPIGGDVIYSLITKLIGGKSFNSDDIFENTEFSAINQLINTVIDLWNYAGKLSEQAAAGSEIDGEKVARTFANAICSALDVTGVPATNIKNAVYSVIGYLRDGFKYGGNALTDNSGQFTDEYLPSKIYNALIDGDVDKAKELEAIWRKELMAGGMSEEKALEKIKGKLVGKLAEDESVVAAAQSKYDGDYSAYDKARQRVIDLGFDEKDVDSAITRNYNKLNGEDKTEEEAGPEGKTAFDDTGGKKFSKKDAFNALVRGDEKSFELARKYLENNGVDEKELTSYMRSWSTTESLWDRYFTAYQKSDSKTMKELKAVLVRIYGSEEEFKLKVSGKNGKGGYYEKWNERSIE